MGAFIVSLVRGIIIFSLVTLAFYLLNHGVMEMQGLPLNLDLSPR